MADLGTSATFVAVQGKQAQAKPHVSEKKAARKRPETRECRACGGSKSVRWSIQSRKVGRGRWQTHIPPIGPGYLESAEVRATRQALQWALENQTREYRCVPYGRHVCPVCLGSGRVEAKPSVRDAVADAETLAEGAVQSCLACGGTGYRGLDDCGDCANTGVISQYPVGTSLCDAAWQGERLACLPRLPHNLSEDQMVAAVRIAARAAFRACPELRGDA